MSRTLPIVMIVIVAAVVAMLLWRIPTETPPPEPAPEPQVPEVEAPVAQLSEIATKSYVGSVIASLGESLEDVVVTVKELPSSTGRSASDGRFGVEIPMGIVAHGTFRKRGFATRTVPLQNPAQPVVLHTGGTLLGTLTDSSGKPIAGARVEIAGFRGYSDEVASDSAGRFEASSVPGAVVLTIHSDRHADQRVVDVVLGDGELIEREFTLVDGTVLEVRLGGAGKPVRDARVRVVTTGGDIAEGRTDSAGLCRLGGLATGKATLVITQPGFAEHIEPIVIAPETDVLRWPVGLDPATRWIVDIRTPARKEATDVEITVRRLRQELARGAPDSAALNILAAGRRYDIEVHASGYPRYFKRWGPAPNAATLKVSLAQGGRFTGRIVDGTGTALADGQILITRQGTRDRSRVLGPDMLATSTTGGTFRTALLDPGDYRLQVHHPMAGSKILDAVITPAVDTDLGEIVLKN